LTTLSWMKSILIMEGQSSEVEGTANDCAGLWLSENQLTLILLIIVHTSATYYMESANLEIS